MDEPAAVVDAEAVCFEVVCGRVEAGVVWCPLGVGWCFLVGRCCLVLTGVGVGGGVVGGCGSADAG